MHSSVTGNANQHVLPRDKTGISLSSVFSNELQSMTFCASSMTMTDPRLIIRQVNSCNSHYVANRLDYGQQ